MQTAAEAAHAQNRTDLARRLASEVLRRAAERHIATDTAELIWWFEALHDSEKFLCWRAARASKCPSNETWAEVHQLLRARLPLDENLRLVGPCGSAEPEHYEAGGDYWRRDDAAVIATHDVTALGDDR